MVIDTPAPTWVIDAAGVYHLHPEVACRWGVLHAIDGGFVLVLDCATGVEPGPVGATIGHPTVPTIMRYGPEGKVIDRDYFLAEQVHPNTYAFVMDRDRYGDTDEMKLIGRKGGCLAVMTLGRAEDKFRALVEAWWKGRRER